MFLGWLDQRVAAPIMKERINDGSERYFEYAEKHWGESEIQNILDARYDEVSEPKVGIRFPTRPPRSES